MTDSGYNNSFNNQDTKNNSNDTPYNTNLQPYNTTNDYNYFPDPVIQIPNTPSQKLLRRQFCFAWMFIVFVLTDIILEIVLGYVNPYSIGDNVAIIVLATIFLVYSFKMQSVEKRWIQILTIFLFIAGFIIRASTLDFGIESKGNFTKNIINFIIFGVRSLLLFLCIHLTCQTDYCK